MTRPIGCAAALAMAMGLLVGPSSVAAAEPEGCALGWFVVEGDPLLDDTTTAAQAGSGVRIGRHVVGSDSVHGRVVSLVGDEVAAEGICPPTRAQVVRKRKQVKLRASWDGCGAIAGTVRLRATIDAATCGTMRGKVAAKKFKPKRARFTATRTLGNPQDCTEDDTFNVI